MSRSFPTRYVFLSLVMVVSFWFLVTIYDQLIEMSRYSAALRMPKLEPSLYNIDLALGLVYVLIPLIWLRLTSHRPSKALYVFVLFSVLMPSILFLSTNEEMGFRERHLRCLFCVVCFFVLYIPYFLPVPKLPNFQGQRQTGWIFLLGFLSVASLYLFSLDPSAVRNVSLLDVYDQRLEIRSALESGEASRVKVYLTNWVGLAFAPFLICYGIFYRRWSLIPIAFVVAIIAFAISSHKSVLFAMLISGLFAVGVHYRRLFFWPKNLAVNIAFSVLVAFMILPLIGDIVIGRGTMATWLTSFRLVLNNGYLTSAYFEYFGDKELLVYSESFLRSFIPSDNELSYSRRVGDFIMQYNADNNANANFLADGYANLGYTGMIIACLQMAVVLWVIDGLAQGRNAGLVACMILPAGLAFSNVPVHTGLVSNGVAILMLLITLLPRKRRADEPSSQMTT